MTAGEESLQQFFSRMQARYRWENSKVALIVKALQEQEIKTASALKDCWEDVKDHAGMSIGIKKMVGKELENM